MRTLDTLIVASSRVLAQEPTMHEYWEGFSRHFAMMRQDEITYGNPNSSGGRPITWMVLEHSPKPSEYGNWNLRNVSSENFRTIFILQVAKVGKALEPPIGTSPVVFWFDRLREYLNANDSGHLLGVDEDNYVIERVCEACSTFCAHLAIQALLAEPVPSAQPVPTHSIDTRSREERLRAFIFDHKTSVAAICRSAGVFKPNMQQWRHEELPDDSVMAVRIEDVLSGNTPLVPKGKKTR